MVETDTCFSRLFLKRSEKCGLHLFSVSLSHHTEQQLSTAARGASLLAGNSTTFSHQQTDNIFHSSLQKLEGETFKICNKFTRH